MDTLKFSIDIDAPRESYYLSDKNRGAGLNVELDSVGEFKDYFNVTFPKTLQLLK